MLSRAFDDSSGTVRVAAKDSGWSVVMLSRAFDDSSTIKYGTRKLSDDEGRNALTSVR